MKLKKIYFTFLVVFIFLFLNINNLISQKKTNEKGEIIKKENLNNKKNILVDKKEIQQDILQLEKNNNLNPHDVKSKLDENILVFPDFSEDYKEKLINRRSGDFQILTQNQILNWASSNGISISEDNSFANLQYQRAIYFNSPGLMFHLTVKKDDLGQFNPFGQILTLDFALYKPMQTSQSLTSNYSNYQNLQEIEIFVDSIFYMKLIQGYGKVTNGPIRINIPFVRDKQGSVKVELRLKNHPGNFGILYDAHIGT